MKIRLQAKLEDLFPEMVEENDPWTEERISHEVSRLGGWLKTAFLLDKIEYTHTGTYAYYMLEMGIRQAQGVFELMGVLTMFDATTQEA